VSKLNEILEVEMKLDERYHFLDDENKELAVGKRVENEY
jgi:hypothetical protein